ncbi:D-glycerate dehydrogenase [Halobacillus shinanisalinarum]|uniref:D-glycerate dehydrogenase n=1 Tax=Halobacillus shinanisalinarum TaxID=2932258 RepID=A0ABY4H5M0_9BACI|nr:D-glycerate dehydrogenase [Halobacillus shinanisalinarum]UOQ94237.1 D-glycerate dehydrogenase [Halobacillus shinanisalinarum]
MTKPYIFITRKLPDEVVDPFREQLDISMWDSEEVAVDPERLLKEAKHADGLLTMLSDSIDGDVLRQASNLKVVANLAVGFDNIDIEAAKKHSITVTNTPDVLTETTADLTFGLLMATARRMMEAASFVKEGKWEHWSPLLMAGSDIHHKTIGIVGMGRIGEAVAKRARGFNMNVLYHNRTRKQEVEDRLSVEYVNFDSLISKADFVVSLVPLTEETEKLFNEEIFNRMKREAIFINVSRGKVMDEKALYQAITTGEIRGAGLDVFQEEPISETHPLLSLKEVVCLPHIGSASRETRYNMMKLSLDNVLNVLQGSNPLTPVN